MAMELIRSIRVYLPDRPGALSALTAALASHGVNILRLRIVSSDEGVAVDDLELAASTTHEIETAMAAFPTDVSAITLGAGLGDPVLAATRGLGAIATAANRGIAEQRLAGWVLSVLRADAASLVAVTESGARHVSGAAFAPPSAALLHMMGTVLEDGDPLTVERFEGYVAGFELCNAFTELNDPLDQEQRFLEMGRDYADGDEEKQPLDEDYLRAMRYGMPPNGGFGMGVDRLADPAREPTT